MVDLVDVRTNDVSFIIKGFVHDRYFHGHIKIKDITIRVFKIKTVNDLPDRDVNGIPTKDPIMNQIDVKSNNDGLYVICANNVPSGVYCILAEEVPVVEPPAPPLKYDVKRYYISIDESGTYVQDIVLLDTIKGQKIDRNPHNVSIHEIFMKA